MIPRFDPNPGKHLTFLTTYRACTIKLITAVIYRYS